MIEELKSKTSLKAGLPPGSVVLVGEQAEPTRLFVMDYDEVKVEARGLPRVEEAIPFLREPTITWLSVTGMRDVDVIEQIGSEYGIHPLTLEDVVHLNQRPKVEVFDDYIFAVVKIVNAAEQATGLEIQQVSLIIGMNFVITFQERETNVLEPLRERIRKSKGRIRKMGADYLGYAILDAIVDQYFVVLEAFEETLERLEDQVLEGASQQVVERLHATRSSLLTVRKQAAPLREALTTFTRTGEGIIKDGTLPYMRDLYDHVLRITESLDFMRESIAGLRELYLTNVSNRMNEVMKVLTIIATIFIPLTFLAGIYGMNFEYMPELRWRWGYLAVWAVMLVIASWMVRYFRKRNWF